MKRMHQPQLFEGLEYGDLARLVEPELHIDEFKSKLGEDEDVIVLSFLIKEKNPANDLMNFIERGYNFILDADVSAGEFENGEYLVFAELNRDEEAVDNIIRLINDILNLTKQKMADWQFKYHKSHIGHEITSENLEEYVPLSAKAYKEKYSNKEITAMQEVARVPVKRSAPINDWTESLRVAAGLK